MSWMEISLFVAADGWELKIFFVNLKFDNLDESAINWKMKMRENSR